MRGELITPNPKLKLMEQVREILRLKHYAIRTERSYCDWIKRYVHFHEMKLRQELFDRAEAKLEEFLSDLAVNGHVAASTQNQAFNALLFLYQQVLHQQFGNIQAVRADRPVRVPVVSLDCLEPGSPAPLPRPTLSQSFPEFGHPAIPPCPPLSLPGCCFPIFTVDFTPSHKLPSTIR